MGPGRAAERLAGLEDALADAVAVEGPDGEAVAAASEALVQAYNREALAGVSGGRLEASLECLRKAEVLTSEAGGLTARPAERLRLRAVTLNNLAIYYQRKGRPRAAVRSLEEAVVLESELDVAACPAGTHLNLCAVLSSLREHRSALQHAQVRRGPPGRRRPLRSALRDRPPSATAG